MDPSRTGSLSGKTGVRRKSSAVSLDYTDLYNTYKQSNLLSTFGARPSSSRQLTTPTSSASSSFPFPPEDGSISGHDFAESAYTARGSPASAAPPSGSASVSGPDSLSALVQKRVTTWAYLKRAHEGKLHWFNTVLLTLGSLDSALDPAKAATRSKQFYMLGMSLSPLFEMTVASDVVKGLLKLLEEWESWTENGGNKTMKSLFKGPKARKGALGSGFAEYASGFQDSGDASFLMLINMPFQPDYFQVLPTLCDMMIELYTKLSVMLLPPAPLSPGVASPQASRVAAASAIPHEGQRWTPGLAEMINKADAKLKKIISQLTRELDGLARKLIDDELRALLSGASGSSALAPYGQGLETFLESSGERDRGTV